MSGPTNNHALSELDQKVADILAKMGKEQKIIDASNAIRNATKNQDVLRKTDAEEREARRSLEYFQATLEQLKSKRDQLIYGQHSPQDHTSPQDSFGYQGGGQYSQGLASYDKDRSLPSPPHYASDPDPASTVHDAVPRPKQYTNLGLWIPRFLLTLLISPIDLIKADTPHTPAKIQRMLHQLEFKLQVERQYQKGFDLMQRAYNADGDKKSRLDAQNQKIESDKTIQLLTTALKRYKNLHVIEVAEEEETGGAYGFNDLNLAFTHFCVLSSRRPCRPGR
jgi:Hr1 repeat